MYLNHQLSEEERQIADVTRSFVSSELRPHEADVEREGTLDPALADRLRQQAVDAGLYAYNMPRSVGGPDLSSLAQVLVREQLGHTSMALADLVGRPPGILLACTPDQSERYLAPSIRGELKWAFALTEPEAGSDATALTTTARRAGNEWVIDGRKHYISNGGTADYLIVFARAADNEGVTAFIVDHDTPGFSVGQDERMMGWRGYPVTELLFDECRISDEQVLGDVGGGFRLAMSQINEARLGVAAHCVGMAQRALTLSMDHIRAREQFGSPLAAFQGLRWMVADMALDLERTRALLYPAARMVDDDPRSKQVRVAASMAKLCASEMVGRVADTAVQLFGGSGYMADNPVERIYRDARAFRIGEGTSEIQRNQIARAVLGPT